MFRVTKSPKILRFASSIHRTQKKNCYTHGYNLIQQKDVKENSKEKMCIELSPGESRLKLLMSYASVLTDGTDGPQLKFFSFTIVQK